MQDPSRRQRPRVTNVVLYFLGVAGLAAAITLLFLGMRSIMDIGGMCAEGGPYVIEHHCPDGAPLVYLLGFIGGFASIVLVAWHGSSIGGGAGSVVFLAWPAGFGVLGFNFLQYGFAPPGNDPGWAWGWLVTGVVFEAMALGPLLIGVWAARTPGVDSVAQAARATPGAGRLASKVAEAKARREASRLAIEPLTATVNQAAAEFSGEGDSGAAVLVDGLERLAALHDDGSLTDAEYARAKAGLLERAGA